MKTNELILCSLKEYKTNELIFASKVYREKLSGKINETTYYKALERLCKNEYLANAAKGVYYIPQKSKYGIIPLSSRDIISAFTKNGKGMVVGYSLYNQLQLTTQVAKNVQILSSNLEGERKTVGNVIIRQFQVEFSPEVEKTIQGLEVLQNYFKIQDLNHKFFLKYTKILAESYNEQVFMQAGLSKYYKKSTIAFLREILNFYNKKNNLEQFLSELSEYKYPRMEELRAITQI